MGGRHSAGHWWSLFDGKPQQRQSHGSGGWVEECGSQSATKLVLEDGWFNIRGRHSAQCLVVADASEADGANIVQWEKLDETNQQWRFLPVGAPIEFVPPSAPTELVATARAESIYLNWAASPENDVAESEEVTIRPIDFKPVLNYIGRSQYPDPLLNGSIDDFRVYNYALSASDVGDLHTE